MQLGGTLAVVGLAGCAGDDNGDDENEGPLDENGDNNTTDDELGAGNETDGNTTDDEMGDEQEDVDFDDVEHEEPYDNGEVHAHGSFNFRVDGRPHYLGDMEENWGDEANEHFYFSESDGEGDRTWHMHSRGVTLAYAVHGIPVFQFDGSRLAYDGEVYDESQYSLDVNGEEVDPSEYVIERGDTINLMIESDGTEDDETEDGNETDGGEMDSGVGNETDENATDENATDDEMGDDEDDGNSTFSFGW
ncbi:hypothetical protein ACNS7O_05875 [Haloferacaceae archaeon DSL9]